MSLSRSSVLLYFAWFSLLPTANRVLRRGRGSRRALPRDGSFSGLSLGVDEVCVSPSLLWPDAGAPTCSRNHSTLPASMGGYQQLKMRQSQGVGDSGPVTGRDE